MLTFLFRVTSNGHVSTVHVTAQNCRTAAAQARELHPTGVLTFQGVAVMPATAFQTPGVAH
jgi:hypothetical protein